jgi:hypothetical protein
VNRSIRCEGLDPNDPALGSAKLALASEAAVPQGPGPSTVRRAFRERRHGLSIPVLADSGLSKDVENLMHKIVGESSNPGQLEPARRFAEAQVDLARIRHARHELLSSGLDDHKSVGVHKGKPAVSDKKSGAETFVVDLSNQMRTLKRLDRYERRALSRRKSATREFDAARAEAE